MFIFYRGGKKRVAKQIIEQLPPGEMFVDVFGGAANVSSAAVRSGKYHQVVYNDLDANLVTFLETVRDRPDELIEYLCSTPRGRHMNDKIEGMLASPREIERAAGVFFACNFQGVRLPARKAGLLRPRICHKSSVEGVITGPAFRRFFEGKDGGKFPIAVLDPKTQQAMGAKSRTVLLSEQQVAAHPRITLKQYQGIQKNIDSAAPIYLPENRIGYLTPEGKKQRFTVIKTTRDKKDFYFLSTYSVKDRAARSLKRKEIKKWYLLTPPLSEF